MTSISEMAKELRQVHLITDAEDNENVDTKQKQILEQMTVMQGSIWEYSDSQPWFIVGLHKNNPGAARQILESIMKGTQPEEPNPLERRRGTVSFKDGDEAQTLRDSQGHLIYTNFGEGGEVGPVVYEKEKCDTDDDVFEEDTCTYGKRFSGTPETKIVIKKTVELISDMSKSCELAFHATRAVTRFLTYPTPSVPSDNFMFGHAKGWLWLMHKGFSHFNHEQTDKKDLDVYLKTFRREMSLLAKEMNECVSDLRVYMSGLKKLNVAIRKEAKFLQRHNSIWISPMVHYFRYVDEVKSKHQILIDVHEDRFFPTDWIFEPHPSQTKIDWDFFHFQWIDLNRDWIDNDFEVRSDYSIHWTSYTSFSPDLQSEIIVQLIHHFKALIEECHQFHKFNIRLSFDYQEVKFLNFAVEEILKLKKHHDAVDFIANITRKLFEDLALLEKISEEYLSNLEWLVAIIEPCYLTLNAWLADDLILPLEYPGRSRRRRGWIWNWNCSCFRKPQDFFEMFGDSLKVVLLRSPISIPQREKFFPYTERLQEEDIPQPFPINLFGTSKGYNSSIFDTGLGRERPLPIHHPLPKYKKRQEQKYNIFDIHRLIEAIGDCKINREGERPDVDIEKYLVIVEEIQRFLAVFGTIFNFVTSELRVRVENLELLIYNNLPEYYESLERMIVYEMSRQTENTEKSGVKSFIVLHKILQFIVLFLEKVSTLEESEITYYAGKAAYYKSYAKVQSWIYQKAATFAMYSLPTKMEMFMSLFAELDKSVVDVEIREFIKQGFLLLEICDSILKTYNLVDCKCG